MWYFVCVCAFERISASKDTSVQNFQTSEWKKKKTLKNMLKKPLQPTAHSNIKLFTIGHDIWKVEFNTSFLTLWLSLNEKKNQVPISRGQLLDGQKKSFQLQIPEASNQQPPTLHSGKLTTRFTVTEHKHGREGKSACVRQHALQSDVK